MGVLGLGAGFGLLSHLWGIVAALGRAVGDSMGLHRVWFLWIGNRVSNFCALLLPQTGFSSIIGSVRVEPTSETHVKPKPFL
jgi:hypothetical protein